jgi:hypothetical protein
MENLLLALAVILALNLAFGVRIALSEFRSRRKLRREVGALESMWARDRSPAERGPRHRRFASRTIAAAAAALVLSGVAVAATSTTREAVLSTVGGVIDRFTEEPDVEAAGADATIGPSAGGPTASASDGAERDGATRDPNDEGAVGTGRSASSAPAPSIATPSVVPSTTPSSSPSESPAPPMFTARAEPLTATTIRVSWDLLPSASSYLVERSPDGVDAWEVVAQFPAGETSTIAEVTPGTYSFRVTATTDVGPMHATASASTDEASVPE